MASLGGMVAGSFLTTDVVSGDSGTVIGNFEDGLDGWRTNGRNQLSRTTETESPFAVTVGEHALSVTSGRDPKPMIQRQLDGVPGQYLLADVSIPEIEDYRQTTTVELRLRHSRAGGRGRGNSGNANQRSSGKPTVNLDFKEIPFAYSGTLVWDLTGLDDGIRSNAKRIQLIWYRTESNGRSNPNGNGPGEGYGGTITWDNIRFSDDSSVFQSARLSRRIDTLRTQHGGFRYVYEELDDIRELGRLDFADGHEVPVTLEPVEVDTFELTLDTETYLIELGS